MKKYEGKIKWGIIGTGRIANTFAKALAEVEDAELYAVASRKKEKAEQFADLFNFKKSYGSYEELAKDENIDVVYIATPMSSHYHDAEICLKNGKNVLCEKSVTLNSEQFRKLLMFAGWDDLFFMEAMWMKCRPVYLKMKEWIEKIGEIKYIRADFSNAVSYNPDDRLFKAECGGGALLDLAVYPVTLIHDILGVPKKIISHAHIENGIDLSNSIVLEYGNDVFAEADSGFEIQQRNNAVICGTKGKILFGDCFFCSDEITLLDKYGEEIEKAVLPNRVNGYEYEIEEVNRCLKNGLSESSIVTHKATFEVMEILDECRRQWGMFFPDELY